MDSTRERICRFLQECDLSGDPPTVREIGQAVGLSSPATVHQHLRSLEEDGIVVRTGGEPRRGGSHHRSRGWRLAERKLPRSRPSETIPVVGRIAAGHPLESLGSEMEPLPFSPRAFASSGRIVALQVEGESMVEAGILDGDYAIIRRQPRVENGEIAAVTLQEGPEEREGTLKRWRVKGKRVRLEPASEGFDDIPLRRRTEVRVFGKLVGVIRQFRK